MSTETWILGSLLIAVFGVVLGHCFGTDNKVPEKTCKERRESDKKFFKEFKEHINTRFDNLEKKLDAIKKD